jgi:DNA-binding response OmpR family regulator
MDILVAEDDIISARLLLKSLDELDHRPLLAEDGLVAWEMLQTNDIRMVIANWMMPHMDGFTLCRKVRETSLPRYIYIIILASKTRKGDISAGLNAGADDYIFKPFDLEELAARIRSGQRIIRLEEKYQMAHTQLLQSEKMASIGQLAAGMVHVINNPAGLVSNKLRLLADYQNNIKLLIAEYKKLLTDLESLAANGTCPGFSFEQVKYIRARETETDLDYMLTEIPNLINESREELERIKKIVLDLKGFIHPNQDGATPEDVNKKF